MPPALPQRRRRHLLGLLAAPTLAPLSALAALPRPAAATAAPPLRIAVMPKLVGIAYYDAVEQGVQAAARELPGLAVQWLGPRQDHAERQVEMIERLLPSRPHLLAVAANDPVALAPVLQRARRAGIRLMSWDADATPREFFVNLVDYQIFGTRLVEVLAAQTGPRGDIAIITTSFAAPNQVRWIQAIKRTLYARYPTLRIVDIRPAGESAEHAYRVAQELIAAHPGLRGLVALGVPNLPGAARAVREAGLSGRLALTGNSTPNLIREHVLAGTVRSALLWNARDHGYLTVHCAWQLLTAGLAVGRPFTAGTLGPMTPVRDEVSAQVSLPVLEFSRDNIGQYRF